ncbi:peroxisomal targeting signal 2 receptor [Didymosphaeria variabile]|uniref:Peroxin-7 n=1 Tax=Didymosphaeria variabile TaxID=1932322 RepID=A0A9W8XDC6_9PLEO|nr:peroxisomal targeting signal 2 receptor [Didymosphaeria variabile]KAJ4347127.1 peroxisomal targeting signal 2 receptor [Didymosphaeria variabile]
MLEFRTQGFNGYSVKYSPFFDSRIAVAGAANFGLVGNGRLYVLGLTANGVVAEKWFDTQDSLFDTTWSEAHENQLLTAGGDGSVKLFDITLDQFPVQSWQEHAREVFAVHWNLVAKDTFLSSSWDGTIKIWNPNAPASIATLPTHTCTYSAAFSPHSIPPAEALTHDWNKYRDTVVATAGVDRLVRTFDIRAPQAGPVAVLPGHEYAVRRVSWSPHLSDTLLSASYDMTCRVWTDGSAMGMKQENMLEDPMVHGGGRELGRMGRHTEFATGVDWCLFGAEGWCASTGWDERVLVWDARALMQ